MKEEDSQILYRSKIDWIAVYSKNKIYCAEPRCDFYTKIDNEDLTKHLIADHNYGKHPCSDNNCDYVGYSKINLNHHSGMHKRRFEKEFWHKCSRLGCKSTFKFQFALDVHNRIHDNDLDVCRYCPYRYVEPAQYTRHLKMHFGIRDYECDQCDLKFTTQKELNIHYQKHEGIIYNCLICNNYEAYRKNNILSHLRRVHRDIFGENINWDSVKEHVKIKKVLDGLI